MGNPQRPALFSSHLARPISFMTTYLIVLFGTALAWSVIGFALAILLLKWRWNLVGGFLLAFFSWFPVLMIAGVIAYAAWTGTLPSSWFDLEELYYNGPRSLELFSGGGFMAGMIIATFVGLWPRRNDEGKRQRWARTMPVVRIFAIGVLAIGLSWGLFYAADWRASSKLRQIRETYAAKLDEEELLALGQPRKHAAAQEMLLLALLQDEDLAWTTGSNEIPMIAAISPQRLSPNDLELLTTFVPGSQKIDEIRAVVERYQDELATLKTAVLEEDAEPSYWHPLLARLVAYDAVVQLHEDDLEAVLADLKLLREMGTQLLAEGVDAPNEFHWIEFERFLIFQAVHGKHSPVPKAFYEEMQQEMPGLRASIYRNLERVKNETVVIWVDEMLSRPTSEDAPHEHYVSAAIDRMVWSERFPSEIARIQQEIDAYYAEDSPLLYTRFDSVSFPGFWNGYFWPGGGPFFEDLVHHTNLSFAHFMRRKMFQAAREVESFQVEQGRYPTALEFQQMLIDWDFPFPLTLVPLRDRQSGQVVGVLLSHSNHTNLKDQLGIYLGDSLFRLIEHLDHYELTRKDGRGNAVWSFDPSTSILRGPTLPDYPDSTPDDADAAMN